MFMITLVDIEQYVMPIIHFDQLHILAIFRQLMLYIVLC
jgi:hypothetical protein